MVIFLFFPQIIFSQVKVTFEDSNLNKWQQFPPYHWELSSTGALEGKYSLHHAFDNFEAANDRISLLHNPLYFDLSNCVWSFDIKYDYAPSSSNNWAVFIAADRPALYMHPDSNINSYILGINYTGSDDILKLWKLSNNNLTTIINSGFNWQTGVSSSHKTQVKIEREIHGLWSLYIDTTGSGNNFEFLDDGMDNEFTISYYFGLFYKYTATQDRKLTFDNLEINGFFKTDSSLISISDIRYVSSNQINVEFTKPVNTDSLKPSLIKVSEEIGNPSYIKVNSPVCISLHFNTTFINKTNYELSFSYIEDIYGKGQYNLRQQFNYYQTMPYDIVINEIMIDPEPIVGLPAVEYIELFNTTSYDISVHGWTLKVGEENYQLPLEKIRGKSYIIMCSQMNIPFLKEYGNVWGLVKFPLLNNNGETISLFDQEGRIIHSVSFKTNWYKNSIKTDGGWSLEMIDYKNPCGGYNNWAASENSLGGTPGYLNSINAENPDLESPFLMHAATMTDSSVILFFNEPLNFIKSSDPSSYSVDHDIFHPVTASPAPPDFSNVMLTFSKKFEQDKKYKIVVKNELCDCAGNYINNSYADFALASLPNTFDLIINEILFDANEDEEFLEIYNRSDKNIELMGTKIALLGKNKEEILKISYEFPFHFQLFPGQYVVITGNIEKLTTNYYCKNRSVLIEAEKSLLFPDKEGIVALLDKKYKIIDRFYYNKNYHYALLRSTEGVSLERIYANQPTNYAANWHSAAEDAGFATPGYENSQSMQDTENNLSEIWLEPDVITPDNDGDNDYVTIHYKFNHPGFIATVYVFDSRGRLVNELANNMMLGREGLLIWNGYNKDGFPESPGIYIILIQAYTSDGTTLNFKKSLVVARKVK
jgi:hypothetical protein